MKLNFFRYLLYYNIIIKLIYIFSEAIFKNCRVSDILIILNLITKLRQGILIDNIVWGLEYINDLLFIVILSLSAEIFPNKLNMYVNIVRL